MQKQFLCKDNDASGASEKNVTKDEYEFYTTKKADEYTCRTVNIEREVCVWPQGFYGNVCQHQATMKCYLNITNPPLYKTCNDRPDSFYYMYSIPGFDPCHPISFDEKFTLKYEANCGFKKPGEASAFDREERNYGYDYKHIVEAD